jgi:Na+/H+ antiporter NhaC
MVVIYYFIGRDISVPQQLPDVSWWKVLPYIVVILTAILGMNVMIVLLLGLLLTATIGIIDGSYDFFGWMGSLGVGINSMGEIIIMAMLAAGMLEMIKCMGGIDYLIDKLTKGIHGRRGAETAITSLVCLVDVCTANNTVSIITTGPIAHSIAKQYHIDPRRSASLLDTASCFTQGLIPYSAQLLTAAGLVEATSGLPLNPMLVVPYLFYPMGLGIMITISIIFQPRILIKK